MNRLLKNKLLTAQQAEITEYHIYTKLAGLELDQQNQEVLLKIARDEKAHYEILKTHTCQEVQPDQRKIRRYFWMARVLGITFTLRLMEKGEGIAQDSYGVVAKELPEVAAIQRDEYEHEQSLLDLLQEERLKYASSMVLGLNDALVELTGAIAGFTLALQNPKLILLVSLVTGISASLSMAASEYLSTKADESGEKDPLKAAVYTGCAYVVAVAVLVLPFLVISAPFAALAWTLGNALLLILGFTYYISLARNKPFWPAYLEMAGISMGVAVVSFGIGLALRHFVGVDV